MTKAIGAIPARAVSDPFLADYIEDLEAAEQRLLATQNAPSVELHLEAARDACEAARDSWLRIWPPAPHNEPLVRSLIERMARVAGLIQVEAGGELAEACVRNIHERMSSLRDSLNSLPPQH